MTRIMLVAAALLALTTATAYAALNNDNKTIQMVDVMAGERLYLHLYEPLDDRPGCAKFSKIAACSLTDEWCREVSRMAFGAQMAGKKVELNLNGDCIGTVAEFHRFRVKP